MQQIKIGTMAMDKLGLGTWKMSGPDCTTAILGALDRGYRHIDTAEMYANEAEVGDALAQTKVARSDIHLTTKVWWEHLAPAAMRQALETSLTKLKTSYVDLYLIHWPAPDMNMAEAIGTLMRLREEGLARNIGVSNFTVAMMREAKEVLGAPIVANQVEYHVLLGQPKVLTYARAHEIAVTAYCPLARGGFDDYPVMAEIAKKHGCTPEQVALKWLLDQDGVAAIPKASQPANQQANLDAWKVSLDDADRAAVAALPKNKRIVDPAFHPGWDV